MQPRKRLLRTGILLLVMAVCAVFLGRAWIRWHRVIPPVAWDALADADSYELYVIEADYQKGGLDLYPLVGKAAIDSAADRSLLNDALERTAGESKGWQALCFEPHDGIRVSHGGVTTDFVICFKCLRVQVWQGDRFVSGFSANESAEPAFDRVLAHVGLKPNPRR